MKVALGFVFCLLVLSNSALGEDNKEMALMGSGAMKCKAYRTMYEEDQKFADNLFMQWVLGYLSGLNNGLVVQKLPTVKLGEMSNAEKNLFLRLYCRKNPETPLFRAVQELFFELEKQ